jgi:hypothetical protein
MNDECKTCKNHIIYYDGVGFDGCSCKVDPNHIKKCWWVSEEVCENYEKEQNEINTKQERN